MHIQPFVPARSCFIFPSGPGPMTVAPLAISGGAALVAFAIVAASDIAAGFALCVSWAYAAQLARIRTLVRPTTIFLMIDPLASRRSVDGRRIGENRRGVNQGGHDDRTIDELRLARADHRS